MKGFLNFASQPRRSSKQSNEGRATANVTDQATEVPPPPAPVPKQPEAYGLKDEDYLKWKRAYAACRKSPEELDPLKELASNPKLLNWRSPVSGQSLLHELAAKGASQATLDSAVQLGCQRSQMNSKGETADMIVEKKLSSKVFGGAFRSLDSAAMSRSVRRSRASSAAPQGLLLESSAQLGVQPQLQQLQSASLPVSRPMASQMSSMPSSMRKKGVSLQRNEVTSMPKAQISLDLDFGSEAAVTPEVLQQQIQSAYGSKARVQIDELSEAQTKASRSGRWQNVKCRVMCDDAGEAKSWLSSGSAQTRLATAMNCDAGAVEFESAAKVDEVDAITMKLDSDSAHILCGACLLYNADNECTKVVCHSDRNDGRASIMHSGDTQVDGKSVHTITVVQSKVPEDVTQLYFTLCSCGPADLSGFLNPSIMLYQNSQPDANLLEYSINQAAKSVSCVMARMIRQPMWTKDDRVVVACVLRRLRMPLLCIDLCLAMAAETSWSIQALGTEDWNMPEKICGNYDHGKRKIEQQLKENPTIGAKIVSVGGPSGSTGLGNSAP